MNSRILIFPVAAVAICQPALALVYMSVEQAQQLMFKGQSLTAVPVILTAADVSAIERDSGVKVYPGVLRAWKAEDGGYFFVDAVIGKHELITYAVALGPDGKVGQVEIIEYREAYGGEVRSERWRAQFVGKQHGDAVHVGRDIQNISGATMSSEHLTEGIRRLLSIYAMVLAGH
ncbi:MAG TPA: FMN-binding protein [Steroidobacteraceae bacterium]|jgi:hypothetical protein|nr:FMN-binding protein [Steroidobacteraceae bacterium]